MKEEKVKCNGENKRFREGAVESTRFEAFLFTVFLTDSRLTVMAEKNLKGTKPTAKVFVEKTLTRS